MTEQLPVNTPIAPITTALILTTQRAVTSSTNTASASRSSLGSTNGSAAAGSPNSLPKNPPQPEPLPSQSPLSSQSALFPTCPPNPHPPPQNPPLPTFSTMVVWLAGPNRVRVEEEVYNHVVDCHSPNATAEQIEVLMQKLGHRSPGLEVILAVIAEIRPNCTGTYAGNKRK